MKRFLLVVDIQRGFINENTLPVKEKIDNLIRSNTFDCVIATVYRNYKDSPISCFMGWREMMSEEEQQLVGEASAADYFIYKINILSLESIIGKSNILNLS